MPRYIDAVDAIRVLSEYYHHRTDSQKYVLAEAISRVPTADVVERKRGKWTHDGSKWANRFICSECGYKLFDEPTNFCPNCGAEMERSDNGRLD